MSSRLVLYGAHGYTGRLIAEALVSAGVTPLLAGRDGAALHELARRLGTEHRVASLEDAAGLDALLGAADVVLHAAGPFARTSAPMVDACLRTGTHYLDITGELSVFEALADRDGAARRAGVLLLPGVGFDVVPSDALAAHLHARLPDATRLDLAFLVVGGMSRGTARTVLDGVTRGAAVRRDGRLLRVRPGSLTRDIDFGRGERTCVAVSWGDLVTAWHTTGIPDIVVWAAADAGTRRKMALAYAARGLLRRGPLRAWLERRVDALPRGPDADARARGRAYLWGEARAADGRRVSAWMRTPEAYTFTARAAAACARRVLEDGARPGFATPAGLWGVDVALSIDKVVLQEK